MDYFELGEPCTYCGVRSDVACRHRMASRPRPPLPDEKVDRRKVRGAFDGNGRNFHKGK